MEYIKTFNQFINESKQTLSINEGNDKNKLKDKLKDIDNEIGKYSSKLRLIKAVFLYKRYEEGKIDEDDINYIETEDHVFGIYDDIQDNIIILKSKVDNYKNNSDEKKYYELGLKVCKMYVKAIEITTYGEPDKLIKFASSIIPEVKKLHIIGNKIGKTGKFNPCG
jgi:hypothetical protein